MDYEERFDEKDPVYRILWHSHVGGQATFSQTDLKSHDDIGRATALDAMFALVLNNRGQASANLEVYQPFRIGTQVELLVVDDVEEVDLEPYKRAIAKKCQVIPPPPPATYRTPVVAGVVTMGKWEDDDMYEADGYLRAWRKAVAMLADGYRRELLHACHNRRLE